MISKLKIIDEQEWIDVIKQLPECNEEFGDSNYVLGFEQPIANLPVVVYYNNNSKEWHVAHYKADSLPVIITHWRPLPDTYLLTQ